MQQCHEQHPALISGNNADHELLPQARVMFFDPEHSRQGTLYASDRRMKRSPQVFTGANLSRGTTTAPASSKHSMADPMAVSSWKTGVDDESLGLTVFLFLMSGRGRVPFDCASVSLRRSRFTQRLLVLKNLCLQPANGFSVLRSLMHVCNCVVHLYRNAFSKPSIMGWMSRCPACCGILQRWQNLVCGKRSATSTET